MAREIVITSVPRGVKLGRTGFQVAMQTAGMRDDVAALLEKMAGYRHLPAGAGANPVCYFHRHARTVAGPLNVVGRIVDAGVDFSNRSNKLAHMVVLEQADLAAVAGSSPAAVLAAVEGRLAATWPGGPEERQGAFNLAGIPPSQPAPCGTWQQVMGDAGWAGVLADRAVRGQPTLIIGPDSSPASCRRMLALFQEALAIVPPAKRWAVTFDTTTLAPDGVLWRGTYAGSPESQATQPGLLVVDLGRPQPLPADLAVGDLVLAARTGQGPAAAAAAAVPVRPAVPAGPAGPRPVGGSVGTFAGPGPVVPVGGPLPVNDGSFPGVGPAPYVPVGPPTPPPGGDGLLPPEPARKGWTGGLVAGLITLVLLLGIGIAGVAGVVAWMKWADDGRDVAESTDGKKGVRGGGKKPGDKRPPEPPTGQDDEIAVAQALAKVQAYTNDKSINPVPTVTDYQTVLGVGKPDPATVEFVNFVLALKPHEGLDRSGVFKLVKAVETVQDPKLRSDVEACLEACDTLLKGPDFGQEAATLLGKVAPPGPFRDGSEFRDWAEACKELVALAHQKPEGRSRPIGAPLWPWLVSVATTRDEKDKVEQNYSQAEPGFRKTLTPQDLASLDVLADAVRRAAKPPFVPPPPDAAATAGTTPGPQKPPLPQSDPGEDAFKKLQAAIAKAKQGGGARWPLPPEGLSLAKIPGLDAEVVVGMTAGFEPQVERDGDKPEWKVMVDGQCLARVSLADGVAVTRGDAPAEVWAKHESQLKFMPIAFRRPGRPVGKDDWFTLAPPSAATFADRPRLRVLLCGAEGTVPLPLPEGVPPPTAWDQKERPVLADASSPVKVSVRPVGGNGNEFELLFTATCFGTERTLIEPLSVTAADGKLQIHRGRPPWKERASRLQLINPTAAKKENITEKVESEQKPLGLFVSATETKSPNRPNQTNDRAVKTAEKNLPIVIRSLLEDSNAFGDKPMTKVVNESLEAWDKEWKKSERSLDDWKDFLQEYIASTDRGFGKERHDAYAAMDKPPEDPGEFKEPAPTKAKDEKDPDFKKREETWKTKSNEYNEKKKAWNAWEAKARAHVKQAAADPAVLHAFLAERERDAAGQPLPLDAELAAIHVLLGLDGFILAKVHQVEIEERLLDRIPVGSLLAGESALEWTIAGRKEGPVRMSAGRIEPAPVPPAPPPAAAPAEPAASAQP